MKKNEVYKCKNCGYAQVVNYCPNCGQKYLTEVLTTKALIVDALDNIFNVSKQLFTTVKDLFSKPNQVVDAYLSGNRKLYVNPFRFLLVVGTMVLFLFFLLKPYFKFDVFVNEDDKYGIFSILIFTLFTKLFFRKFSFVKCLIANIYLFCFILLISTPLFLLVSMLTKNMLFLLPLFLLLITYTTFSYIKIFKQNPFLIFFKTLVIFILTNLIYTNLLLLIRQ